MRGVFFLIGTAKAGLKMNVVAGIFHWVTLISFLRGLNNGINFEGELRETSICGERVPGG